MRLLSIFLIFCLVAGSCLPLYAEKKISDDQIYDRVRVKLAGDPVVKGGGLEVQVEDGVVTLKGTVKEEKQKKKAERLAKKVKGVTKVINELKVEP
jgi:osmotically-inducible protein OsmY